MTVSADSKLSGRLASKAFLRVGCVAIGVCCVACGYWSFNLESYYGSMLASLLWMILSAAVIILALRYIYVVERETIPRGEKIIELMLGIVLLVLGCIGILVLIAVLIASRSVFT
jgi:hypothetical protein